MLDRCREETFPEYLPPIPTLNMRDKKRKYDSTALAWTSKNQEKTRITLPPLRDSSPFTTPHHTRRLLSPVPTHERLFWNLISDSNIHSSPLQGGWIQTTQCLPPPHLHCWLMARCKAQPEWNKPLLCLLFFALLAALHKSQVSRHYWILESQKVSPLFVTRLLRSTWGPNNSGFFFFYTNMGGQVAGSTCVCVSLLPLPPPKQIFLHHSRTVNNTARLCLQDPDRG